MIITLVLAGLGIAAVVWLISTLVAIRRSTERTSELLERAEQSGRSGS